MLEVQGYSLNKKVSVKTTKLSVKLLKAGQSITKHTVFEKGHTFWIYPQCLHTSKTLDLHSDLDLVLDSLHLYEKSDLWELLKASTEAVAWRRSVKNNSGDFVKFRGKQMWWSPLVKLQIVDLQLSLKRTQAQMFSCEFCDIFRNSVFQWWWWWWWWWW